MSVKHSRRRFLTKSALAGGLAAGGLSAAKRVQANTKRPVTTDLIKVGIIGVEDYTHLPGIWGPTINPTEPEIWPIGRTTRMLMTHCWAARKEKAQEFSQRYGCEVVNNYYDMVDKVDAMIFGGYYEVKWWPQITKPYLEAGIPSFIERPFAVSMKDAKSIIETAKKHNTPILCTDEREYIKEVTVARWKVEELLKEGKTILGVTSDNSAADYPAHGTHGIYFLLAILGLDVEQVSFQADGWWHGTQNWGIISLQYNGISIEGIGEQKRPFVAAQQQVAGHQANAGIRIYYQGGWWDIMNHWTKGEHMERLYYLFFPTVVAMQRMFETRKMQWSYDYILKKTQVYLAGFKSHIEHNGSMVRVNDLPDDWEAPTPYPNWFDEAMFK